MYQGILSLLALTHDVMAMPYWELIGMGGVATLDTQNTDLYVTPYETDTLVQTNENAWTSGTGQLGLGYTMPLGNAPDDADQVQWFTRIQLQANAYYLQGEVDGNGDRFSDYPGDYNDTRYSMRIKSTRLMGDMAVTIISKREFSAYAIAGVGPSWNQISDFDGDELNCIQNVTLNDTTDVNFTYELGAGLTYEFNSKFSTSLQYLYTHFNDLELSDKGRIGTDEITELESKHFDLASQALLLGLRYAF